MFGSAIFRLVVAELKNSQGPQDPHLKHFPSRRSTNRLHNLCSSNTKSAYWQACQYISHIADLLVGKVLC